MKHDLIAIKQFVENTPIDKLQPLSTTMATIGGQSEPPSNADCPGSENAKSCKNNTCNDSTNFSECSNYGNCKDTNNGAITCSSGGGGSHGTGDSPSMICFPSMLM